MKAHTMLPPIARAVLRLLGRRPEGAPAAMSPDERHDFEARSWPVHR